MSEVLSLTVEPRDSAKNRGTGTRVSRKLRAGGRVPAIIYGHRQTPQPISLSQDDVDLLIKKASHIAELSLGGTTEMVLIRDIQWDHLGRSVLHVDFARVSAEETVTTDVRLELHGSAPGVAAGGKLEFLVHSLPISCRATSIPDFIRIEVGGLELGQGIHVRDLVLPEGVSCETDPDVLILQVILRAVQAEATETAAEGPAEPEVIGRKAEEKEEEE